MLIRNRDWDNWADVMAAEGDGELRRRRVTRPRPGHADLVGVLKYDRLDARDILERASARETAARVAAGAWPGGSSTARGRDREPRGLVRRDPGSEVAGALPRTSTPPPTARRSGSSIATAEAEIIARIDQAKKAGDTLGGEVEVVATRRGARARAAMSLGPEARRPTGRDADVDSGGQRRRDRARLRGGPPPGSAVHDPIEPTPTGARPTGGADSAGGATTPAVSRAG